MDVIPIWTLFVATIIIVVLAIEAGYRLGRAVHLRAEGEKESPVSVIAAAILGLVAFMLAFTFGIVSDRFDFRKALVRDEANAIRTAYLRSDFLPELDHGQAAGLFKEYVDYRLAAAQSRDPDQVQKAMVESGQVQRQLWGMAVVNARKDMNSDVAALYIESLNHLIDTHAVRMAVAVQARIPVGIWLVLYTLIILGMIGVGYQAAIAGSTRRSWATPILALSFSLVIGLITTLDRPQSGYITVSQQPLVDVQASIAAGIEARSGLGGKR